MKGNHPRFNQLARMFGNIRDGLNLKQKKTVEEFLFSNSTWIVDTIGEMLGKTKRKKGLKSRVRKRKRRNNKNNKSEADTPPLVDCQGNPTVDGGMMCEAGDSEDDGKVGFPNKMDSDDTDNEGESLDCISTELTDREVGINTNTSFHTFKDVGTKKIYSCPT